MVMQCINGNAMNWSSLKHITGARSDKPLKTKYSLTSTNIYLSTRVTVFCPSRWSIHSLLFYPLYNNHLSKAATATKMCPKCLNTLSTMTEDHCTQNPTFYSKRSPNLFCAALRWSLFGFYLLMYLIYFQKCSTAGVICR